MGLHYIRWDTVEERSSEGKDGSGYTKETVAEKDKLVENTDRCVTAMRRFVIALFGVPET